jgi:ATP-binding cassette subfamily F protein 3
VHVLRATGLARWFGGRRLFAGVDLDVREGDRIGLVGRNGTGKTTLLRMLAGLEPPDDGEISRRRGVEIGYLRQEIDPRSTRTVLEEAREALAPLAALEAEIAEIEAQIARLGDAGRATPADLAARWDERRTRFERMGGFSAEANLRATLAGLGLGADRHGRPLGSLSGGWLMRVELAKLLARRPEVLLLDEPTNHLDLPSIEWFEGVLADWPGAVIVVSHDRAFLDRHARRIVELIGESANEYPGNWTRYLELRAAREAEAAARRENLGRKIAELDRFVERFKAKASKAAQARSKLKAADRLRSELEAPSNLAGPSSGRALRLRLPRAPRSGERVLRLAGIAKAYGDTRVYRSLDLEIARGERIAMVGPNGAGKSTLLRIAAGVLQPDAGVRELGHNVRVAFYAQHTLEALDASRSVLGELEADAPLDQIPSLRGILGAFLFSGDDVEKRVSVLSGGERARLALAKLLLARANLLVLDEPTNHLDVDAQDAVARALLEFDGTLLMISHDRTFISRLATRVLEVTPGPDGARLESFAGGWEGYAVKKQEQAARAAAAQTPPRARNSAATAPSPRPRKRAFTERRLRERAAAIEREIEQAEAERERLGWLFADPAIARDGDRMRALEAERRALEVRLAALYADWETAASDLENAESAGV